MLLAGLLVAAIPGAGQAGMSPPSEVRGDDSGEPRGAVRSDIPGARLDPLSFAAIPGWAQDDHAGGLAAFARSCEGILARGGLRGGPVRGALGPAMRGVCQAALALAEPLESAEARAFFEAHFVPHRVVPDASPAGDRAGFATAYFEPVVPGASVRSARFSRPLLKRPSDLARLDGPQPGLPVGYEWARVTREGPLPYPDRAAIETGAIDDLVAAEDLVIAWLDPVDAFYVHIQGSARIALDGGASGGGRDVRVTFAAKAGHPYTAIGRVLVRSGALALEEADMAGIRAWLAANPKRQDEILHANRSYIFFAVSEGLDPDLGPIGAEGVPLTPGRSIAVDRHVHAFGLPVWIGADLGPGTGWHRLMVAQDTGSAILGPARADLFIGSGDAAGAVAGPIAAAADFVLLLPREGRP